MEIKNYLNFVSDQEIITNSFPTFYVKANSNLKRISLGGKISKVKNIQCVRFMVEGQELRTGTPFPKSLNRFNFENSN